MSTHVKIIYNSSAFTADLTNYPIRITNDTIDSTDLIAEIFNTDSGNGSDVWFSFDEYGSQLPVTKHTTLHWDETLKTLALDVLCNPTASGGITIYLHVGGKPVGYNNLPSGYGDDAMLAIPFINSLNDVSGKGRIVTEVESGLVLGDQTSPDGTTPATTMDGTDHINIDPYTQDDSFEVPGGFTCTGLAYDPVSRTFWIGEFDNGGGNPRLVETSLTGTLIRKIVIVGDPQGIAYDTSDDTLWYVDTTNNTIRHIDKEGNSVGSDLALGFQPSGLTYKASTDEIYLSNYAQNGNIYRYDCATLTLQETFKIAVTSPAYLIDSLLYLPDSDELLAITDTGDSILRIDAAGSSPRPVTSNTHITNAPEHMTMVGTQLYYTSDQLFHNSIANGNRVYSARLNNQNSTFSLWFTFVAKESAQTACIFQHGESTADIGYGLFIGSATELRLFAKDEASLSFLTNSSVSDLSLGWNHLAVIIDRDASTMKTYLNSVEIMSLSISNTKASIEAFYPAGISYAAVLPFDRGISGDFYNFTHYGTNQSTGWVKADFNLQGASASTFTTTSEIETTTVWDVLNGGFYIAGNHGTFS